MSSNLSILHFGDILGNIHQVLNIDFFLINNFKVKKGKLLHVYFTIHSTEDL